MAQAKNKDGKISVTKDGKDYLMWPVDAREAVLFGEYTYTNPLPAKVQAPIMKKAALPPWKDAAGKFVKILNSNAISLPQLRDILRENGETFRSDTTKEDLLAQWNAFVEAN